MMIHVGTVSIEPPNIMLEANKQVRTDNNMFDVRIYKSLNPDTAASKSRS